MEEISKRKPRRILPGFNGAITFYIMQQTTSFPATSQYQIPPYSEAEEAAALGCILMQAESEKFTDAENMLDKLSKSHFYDLRHREIYSALRVLHIERKPLTTLIVREWLRAKGAMEDAGGIAYVASLADNATPGAFDSNLATLRDKASRRALLEASALARDLAMDETSDSAALCHDFADVIQTLTQDASGPKTWIRFFKPSELRDYEPPVGYELVGNRHIVRGAITVIGGPPGAGKSRAAIALAQAGKTREAWLGLAVHRNFKTLVIQNENGRYRLKMDFADVAGDSLDDYIRICEPPPNGMAFDRVEFRRALVQEIREFKPDLIIFDPWNSAARDDRQQAYLETMKQIQDVLPTGDDAPALVIVAHTRKPRADERANGRALLNMLAGSYVLGSVPRCVFIMQPASDEVSDERIVWTCCKNNDGQHGERTAWYRRNGTFEPCADFDWERFDGKSEERRGVTVQDLATVFENGVRQLSRKAAVERLKENTGLRHTACYDALKPKGKFAAHLVESDGLIAFKP